MTINAPDLTQRPPRSPRVRLGGYCILPRLLDKGRATAAGKQGEYCYNCPLDQRFFEFAGIDAKALLKELKKNKGDGEVLKWIQKQSKTKPTLLEILNWSAYQDQRGATDLDSREFFQKYHAKLAPHRTDIGTWFDVLDLDDHVTFGGKA